MASGSGMSVDDKEGRMIELRKDRLVFRFPDVHQHAELTIDFQRTLRIPDDGQDYPLPAGLGPFPLRHVDDFADGVPDFWLEHGGVLLPMRNPTGPCRRSSSDSDRSNIARRSRRFAVLAREPKAPT